MQDAQYRKHTDRTQNSSTYHKKDCTNVRAILKEEARVEVRDEVERWEEDNASWESPYGSVYE